MVLDVSNFPSELTDARVWTLGLGAALLLFGRRLYSLLLGAVGFGAGLWAATTPPVQSLDFAASPEARLLIALVLGVVAASLTFVVQRVALIAGGIGAGGFGGLWIAGAMGGGPEGWTWALPIGGAAIGGLLLPRLFKTALMLLSVWVGAALLVQSLPVHGPMAALLALGLMMVGVLVQTRGRRRGERRERKRTERRSRRKAVPVT